MGMSSVLTCARLDLRASRVPLFYSAVLVVTVAAVKRDAGVKLKLGWGQIGHACVKGCFCLRLVIMSTGACSCM